MANMLRKKCSHRFGCCDHCARGKALHLKPGPRERHNARAIEKREWKKQENV
jgi:hypothetical protein